MEKSSKVFGVRRRARFWVPPRGVVQQQVVEAVLRQMVVSDAAKLSTKALSSPAPFNIPPKATYNPHSTSPCAARFPSVSSCSFMFQKYIIQVHHDCQIFMKIFVSDCDWQRKDGRRQRPAASEMHQRREGVRRRSEAREWGGVRA